MEWYQSTTQFAEHRTPLEAMRARARDPIGRTTVSCTKISLATDGAADLRIGTTREQIAAGQLVILQPGVTWSARPRRSVTWMSILGDAELVSSLLLAIFPSPTSMPRGLHPQHWDHPAIVIDLATDTFQRLRQIFEEMAALTADPWVGRDADPKDAAGGVGDVTAARRAGLLLSCIDTLLPPLLQAQDVRILVSGALDAKHGTAAPQVSPAVRRVTTSVDTDPRGPWTLSTLAEVAGLSPSALERAFARDLRVTPVGYVRRVRLREFRRLLEQTHAPIGQIAREAGWSDPRVASRWFKRTWHTTPQAHRTVIGQNRGPQ